MSERELDIDELRVSHEETARAALDVAGRLADLVEHGPYDTATVALTHGLAASLTLLLRRERQLRRAVKAAVAG